MLIAVFDIGGTSIKYGVANKEGQLLFSSSVPTDAYLGGAAVIQKVVLLSKELMNKWDLHGVSISTAGQIDSNNGIVVYATDNIPNYTGLNIEERVYDQLKLPVKVENDVNCTAIGEHWKGAAQHTDDFLCITLGTGIGGALFLNGQLYTGQGFSAGEIGHITLYPNGKKCTCGANGCYEKYASSLALEDLVFQKYEHSITLIDFLILLNQEKRKVLRFIINGSMI